MSFDDPWSFAKSSIGKYCASLVPQQGIIGLGSGSTSSAFIRALGDRFLSERLDISCFPTSKASYFLAKECGLPLIEENTWSGFCDITFDGADILFPDGTAIKWAGGALLREKIVAHASSKFILMADERKWKDQEKILLPLEVLPFGIQATLSHLKTQGYKAILRKKFISDDSHWIVDIELQQNTRSWDELDKTLKQIPGVIETGVFFKMASECIIGKKDGQITHHKI